MFPPTDNPAQRLLEILKAASPLPNEVISKIWARVFVIPEMDPPTCYRVLGYLNGLVDSIEARVRLLPDINHTLYLRDLPTIRQIICVTNLQVHWHDVKRPLDLGVLTGLEFCAEELSKHHAEDPIALEELTKIRKEFADILRQVSKAELPPDLKLVLMEILTSAILSIDHYKVTGNDGLKKSVAYIIGLMTLHKKEFHASNSDGLIRKAYDGMKGLFNLLVTAYRVKQITGAATEIFRIEDAGGVK